MDLHLLKKFETKTNRVKGLSFHPHRPWILVSLHNGVIQLYDYRMEILLDSFEEHDGPVRGIDFHRTMPLFVSGGDDYKVKVWNYQLRRCLYTLHGHLDYIRTVQFHPNDYPWILSASDDQTVRIWNWQSRTCLLVLTGHNHYVMCAQWHPSEDLILSASLDQTIRIWDISGLRKRSTSIVDDNRSSGDVFGNVDAVVKFVLEGHSRGVNWASFHPTMNLVVSGADDREVKVWRMSGARAWETTTYRGHLNNVSCVLFHPNENVIVSNSEDKTLRVWDVTRNQSPLCFRRDNDRYWILASHPRLNLLAAGHDSGMVIFKLSRERPPFDMSGDNIFHYNEGYLRQYSLSAANDTPLMQTRSMANSSFGSGSTKRTRKPRKLLYNPYASARDHNILLWYDGEDSEYELYTVDRKGNQQSRGARSSANAVAFVTRNRFAVLDNSGELQLKNMDNSSKKKLKLPERSVNFMFNGGPGRILLRSPEWVTLFDVSSRKVIREIQIQSRFPVKFVHWSPDFQKVALLARFSVMICDQDLNDICTIYENAKVKSGAWDKSGVFIYTTVTHMKYALPSGDHGIIKTLDEVLYVSAIKDEEVTCMTRESQIKTLKIDRTEYFFKKALTERRYTDVQRLIEAGKLRGESIIAYLQKKGFPEVALRFVEDTQTRFELALECGNIDDAFECAREINTQTCWRRFGEAALMQGNYRYVTEAYKQTLDFEKLMYLFVLTGNYPMLGKLMNIAKQKDDKIMRYNIALLTGNASERVESLKESGQFGLAYLTARTHGLEEEAQKIKDEHLADKEIKLPKNAPDLSSLDTASLLQPPKPAFGPFPEHHKYDWPKLEVDKGFFDQDDTVATNADELLAQQREKEKAAAAALESDEEEADEAEDFAFEEEWGVGGKSGKKQGGSEDTGAAAGAWDDDIEDFMSEDEDEEKGGAADNALDDVSGEANGPSMAYFVMPTIGQSIQQKWLERAVSPADMIAAGAFDLAQESLHRQFGIVNFAPLKPYFMHIYSAAQAEIEMMPNCSDISIGLRRKPKVSQLLPAISLSINHAHDYIKDAYLAVTKAEFEEAINTFRKVLHIIPLLIISSNDELRDVRQMIKNCREYINALRVKLAANDETDANRKFELNAHFTHFELNDAHIFSGLYGAIKSGYTSQNYQTTAVLCRRLLELAVSGKVRSDASQKHVAQVQKVLKKCESKSGDKTELTYNAHDYQPLCASSLEAMSRSDDTVKSPYCGSLFLRKFDGQLSPVCELVRIGANAEGVKYTPQM